MLMLQKVQKDCDHRGYESTESTYYLWMHCLNSCLCASVLATSVVSRYSEEDVLPFNGILTHLEQPSKMFMPKVIMIMLYLGCHIVVITEVLHKLILTTFQEKQKRKKKRKEDCFNISLILYTRYIIRLIRWNWLLCFYCIFL